MLQTLIVRCARSGALNHSIRSLAGVKRRRYFIYISLKLENIYTIFFYIFTYHDVPEPEATE